MANGILNIWGTQYGIPPGNWKDQVSVPYSDVIAVFNVASGQTNVAVLVPTQIGSGVPQGVIIIPNNLGSGSLKFAPTSAPTTYISPTYPTVVSFDPVNLPTDLYFTTVECLVAVRFF
jgi:hypothetical protein